MIEAKLLPPAPLAVVMHWNMAEGVGDIDAIKATFQAMYEKGKGRPAIITLNEAHLPGGHDTLNALLVQTFPEWGIASFNTSHEQSLREAQGFVTLTSPETSLRRVKRQTLPQAHPVYDLLVEKKQRGKKRGVLVTAVDIPHRDKLITSVIANAHLDLDMRGGRRHKRRQVRMISKVLHDTHEEERKVSEAKREFILMVNADWNVGGKPGGRRHTRRMERIARHLGDEFVEATRRGITASIPKSLTFFLDSTEVGIIKRIFDDESLLRRGLHRVSHMGQRSLDHVYTSKTLRAGDWFEIDFGASDHKVVGLMVYEAEQKIA